MECYWKIFWVTVYCSFTQQTLARSQRTGIGDHSMSRSKREVNSIALSSDHEAKYLATRASLPSLNSENMQEMARTFSSSSLPSPQKYFSTKGKSSQYAYKKPKPKFRPIYSNRWKSVVPKPKTRTKISTTYGDLTKQLMKSLLGNKPNMSSIYSETYSLFSGHEMNDTALKRADLDDYAAGGEDETGLAPAEAESRTGLILASTVGLMQAFIVVSTSVGLGGIILVGLGLLLTLVVKAFLAIMLTIYLL